MKDYQVYLNDILERIRRIELFTVDGHDAFNQSLVIQDAVIRGDTHLDLRKSLVELTQSRNQPQLAEG